MGIIIIDDKFLGFATALIRNAESNILISTFKLEITQKPRGRKLNNFFEEVMEKAKNGVKVKLLMNWHDDQKSVAKTNYPASIALKNAGVKVKYLKDNRCCHAKLILVDDKTAIVGSHNLSVKSCASNFELSYLTMDPENIGLLKNVFEQVFKEAKEL